MGEESLEGGVMGVLNSLHGTAAILLLCGLLFVDEAGLPLPLAPSELLLIFGGLLIATGAVPFWVLLPAASVAMIAGLIAGYGWSRAAGEKALTEIAEKVGATETYQRACARLSSTSAVGIGVARMIPGVRPYATLVSGATEVDVRKFFLGAIPALLLWEAVWMAIGMLVGIPAAHFLDKVERLVFRGALLLVIGAVAYLALRQAAAHVEVPSRWAPPRGRLLMAAAIDGAMVATLVGGVLALGRAILGLTEDPWIDIVIVAAIVLGYLLVQPDRPRVTANGVLLR
jgi:membrane-associated protein